MGGRWVHMQQSRHTSHLAVLLARTVMSTNLGLADWIVREEVDYRCRIGSTVLGVTDIDDSDDAVRMQHLAMVNIVCEVLGPIGAPLATTGYSELRWVGVQEFLAAAEARHASLAYPGWDSFAVCVRGLCIKAGRLDLEAACIPN